jgi:hypothetical protein
MQPVKEVYDFGCGGEWNRREERRIHDKFGLRLPGQNKLRVGANRREKRRHWYIQVAVKKSPEGKQLGVNSRSAYRKVVKRELIGRARRRGRIANPYATFDLQIHNRNYISNPLSMVHTFHNEGMVWSQRVRAVAYPP